MSSDDASTRGPGAVVPEAFLSVASHELRTPLQALMLHVDIMRNRVAQAAADVPGPWLLDRLDRMRGLIDRTHRLVDDLLSASEIVSGNQRLNLRTFDLGDLAEEVVAANDESLRWARCPCAVARNGAVVGTWDRNRLERALENLLSNAMKYAPGSRIEVAVEASAAGAVLSVKDGGPGIAEQDRARIFERFQRGAHAGVVGGSGLGLWIVKSIAEAHGGTIALSSAPGAGATFTLRLPRVC